MFKNFIPLCFVIFWIVPVAWVGLMRRNYPLYPAWIAPLFRVTGVFESSPAQWQVFFIEAQTAGDNQWRLIEEKSLFAATPLGNRTRFQPIMETLTLAHNAAEVSRLLDWIAGRLTRSLAFPAPLEAVRIVHFEIPDKFFLNHSSLGDIYHMAIKTHLRSIVDASTNLKPSP